MIHSQLFLFYILLISNLTTDSILKGILPKITISLYAC